MRPVLLGFLLVLALVPGTAGAATVQLRVHPGSDDRYSTSSAVAVFTAEPGEVNDVQVARTGSALRITDVVPLRVVGDHCAAVDEHTVDCAHASWSELMLGDRDDHLRCGDGMCIVGGGEGADLIETVGEGWLKANGDDGADVLRGGGRNDELSGGHGADVLEGGGAYDVLEGDQPAPPYSPDRLDGGEGDDRAVYSRATPVEVTAGVGGGAPGEGDVIAGVETLQGGSGADVLTGDDGPNGIDGGGGNDRLAGGGGDDSLAGGNGLDVLVGGEGADTLIGERGPDRYYGGAGDDRLYLALYPRVQRRPQTALSCGPGTDLVVGPHPRERLRRACESVEIDGLRLTRLAAPLGFRVHHSDEYVSCPARLVAVHGGRRLSRRLRTHRRATVRFPGFTVAGITLRVRPCWRGANRRERNAGGFRALR